MPPKKRKAPAPKAAAGGKRGRKSVAAAAAVEEEQEEEAGPSTARDAMAKLKAADKGKKKTAKPDAHFPYANTAKVVEDYDCMLNQTNIGHNNNKYYIIQVLQNLNRFYAWNRWGRVGEAGQNAIKSHATQDAAIADFKKKFKDKTRNNWDDRANFKPSPGKYTLIEMDADDEEDAGEMQEKLAKLDEIDGVNRVTAECTLDKPTQSLVKLIFDNDMFKEAMANMDIDVKKMPLGKLSKTQIAKGFEVLEEIEEDLKKNRRAKLMELTSRFYTLIPHDFGRQRPPIIGDSETVRKKMDMLLVLADIELAQAMQEEDKKKQKDKKVDKEIPHPVDQNYNMLQCDLKTLDKKSREFKVLENYLKATEGGWRKLSILDVWEVDRYQEGDRFDAHDDIDNRKLLWHGTNVAVVAAILKSGLRIMPHSGGRVGRGIYFASENGKSAGYVGTTAGGIGIMFLNEVALGKEKHIDRDDSSLRAAPKGFDSIVARGRTEPDPKLDTTIELDGKKVVVPQGKPIHQPQFNSSSFGQSEYLIYKESQNRIRYMLKIKFG